MFNFFCSIIRFIEKKNMDKDKLVPGYKCVACSYGEFYFRFVSGLWHGNTHAAITVFNHGMSC